MNNKNYDNYVVFLLGTDDFGAVSDELHNVGYSYGMDTEYNLCIKIAENFQQYDELHNNYSQYDNLSAYLFENEKQILNFIKKEINN